VAIHRRKGRKNLVNTTTDEDLVHCQFTVTGLDRLWLTDITEQPTAEGKLYCAAVMDACGMPPQLLRMTDPMCVSDSSHRIGSPTR
jgi:hypothetical protein